MSPESGKTFRLGTHRIVSPEVTLARAMPLARRMGITRVAVLTGLDVIGIPTVAAVRPNSRSVAQHQGKGVTLAAAKASAVMEAAEAYHAEHFTGPLRLASFDEIREIGPATDPMRLPGATPSARERLLWAEGVDLMTGGPCWAPHELITQDYTEPQLESRFAASSSGLASGNNRLEAVLHGLYELIERDATAIFDARTASAQEARVVDPDTIDGRCSELVAAFLGAGVLLRVWDQTSDVGLPVFRAMCAPSDDADPCEPEIGYGCHSDREIALSRALTEAAQCRLTRISGARDDYGPAAFTHRSRRQARDAARRCFEGEPRLSFQEAFSRTSDDLNSDLDHVLSRLDAVGCNQACHVDLTRPELAIPVARIVVPGLLNSRRAEEDHVPGERARALPSQI